MTTEIIANVARVHFPALVAGARISVPTTATALSTTCRTKAALTCVAFVLWNARTVFPRTAVAAPTRTRYTCRRVVGMAFVATPLLTIIAFSINCSIFITASTTWKSGPFHLGNILSAMSVQDSPVSRCTSFRHHQITTRRARCPV